jgi:hypothetical protein
MYGLSKTIIRVTHNEIYFFFRKYSICSLILRISDLHCIDDKNIGYKEYYIGLVVGEVGWLMKIGT